MMPLTVAVALLVLLLPGCNQKAEYRSEGTGPSSSTGQTAKETTPDGLTNSSWVATQATLMCKRKTDVMLALRMGTDEQTRSDPATFEDRQRKGRILDVPSGQKLQVDDQRIGVTLLNGQKFWYRRAEFVGGDESGERGLVREDHIRRQG